jgi:hypothetical protein
MNEDQYLDSLWESDYYDPTEGLWDDWYDMNNPEWDHEESLVWDEVEFFYDGEGEPPMLVVVGP